MTTRLTGSGLAATPRETGPNSVPALSRNRDGGFGDAAPLHDEPRSAEEEEILFLRRKVQYLQSVSTVFRQKVALILRECKKDPSLRFSEFEQMYTTAMSEMAKAELEDFKSPGSPYRDGAQDGPVANRSVFGVAADGTPLMGFAGEVLRYQRARASRDDIKRTHHLCTILQEKNDVKAREVKLRKDYDALQHKYSELEERFTKFIELQATGSGAAAAQDVLSERREKELQQELIAARTEIQRLKIQSKNGGNPNSPTQSSLGGYPGLDGFGGSADVQTLAKQNHLLKGRLQKLKEESSIAAQRAAEAATEQQKQFDLCVDQLHLIRSELRSKSEQLDFANRQKNELAKELVQARSQHELLQAKAEALEKEKEILLGDRPVTNEVQLDLHSREMDAATKRIRVLENTIGELQIELDTARTLTREKDVKIESLGTQIAAFRGKMEAVQAAKEEKEKQKEMLNELQRRLNSSLQEMQNSHLATSMNAQMNVINERLKTLEGVEMQLRHKEDELTVAKDQAQSAVQAMNEMKHALQSISVLYMKFPSSAPQLERLIIEHEEYKKELLRCSDEQQIPDAVRVEGVVDLRCLDAQNARPRKPKLRGTTSETPRKILDRTKGGVTPTAGAGGRSTADQSRVHQESILKDSAIEEERFLFDEDDEDDVPLDGIAHTAAGKSILGGARYDQSLLEDLPPPPPLILAASAGTSGSAKPPGSPQAAKQTAAGGTAAVETDARLTFQLFDEKGSGVLPIETIRLCLATLGLSTKRIPSGARQMSIEEFVVLCVTTASD
jgi:hypothetical protein